MSTHKSNSSNTRLVYGDFIPYKVTGSKRQYVSPSTGEVISLRQFQKNATRVPYTPPPKKQKVAPQKRAPPPPKPSRGGTTTNGGGTGGTGTVISKNGTLFYQSQQRANKLDKYYHALDGFIKTFNEKDKNRPGHVPLDRNTARQSPEFKFYYKAYKNTGDRKKGGLRHQALIYFGYLEEEDDYY